MGDWMDNVNSVLIFTVVIVMLVFFAMVEYAILTDSVRGM